MTTLTDLFGMSPFSLAREEKSPIIVDLLNQLCRFHLARCDPYERILKALGLDHRDFHSVQEFPFLPVRLFKEISLTSVAGAEPVKVLASSGTTSQKPSLIFVDRTTAAYQTRSLSRIVQDFVGPTRHPMIIIDTKRVLKDRNQLSARGAGILGFSGFGRDHFYWLNEQMKGNEAGLRTFLEEHQKETILIFGFTFLVWQHFFEALCHVRPGFDLSRAILIHGGGWKRLEEKAVSPDSFRQSLRNAFGIQRIHNYYGVMEQAGSIFMECESGCMHASIFSDVLARNPYDWSVVESSQEGVLEILSLLPHSYPGHVLLTDDRGAVLGEDDCPCGRKGKYFRVLGRVPKAELRGCSDTVPVV